MPTPTADRAALPSLCLLSYLKWLGFFMLMFAFIQSTLLARQAGTITALTESLINLPVYLLVGVACLVLISEIDLPRLRALVYVAILLLLTGRVLAVTANVTALDYSPVLSDKTKSGALARRIVVRGGTAILLAGFALTILELSRAVRSLRSANEAQRAEIDRRKRAEEQLLQAQKLTALGGLVGGVAHNFNNLLTTIQGNTELALDVCSPEAAGLLKKSLAANGRAADLVRQLIAFARQTPLSVRPVAVEPVLREVVLIVRETFDRRIALEVDCRDATRPALADAAQIHQAVLNLCLNSRDALLDALKADPGRAARITIRASDYRPTAEERRAHPDAAEGDFVKVEVRDNGTGLDEAARQRLFEPFFTTKPVGKGTGLGLASVHGMARQHGGWVEVESEPGRGCAMALVLPAAPAEPSPEEDESSIKQGRREAVLVIDDEAGVRGVACAFLARAGYEVLQAADGATGLDMLNRSAVPVRLVFLDLTMPGLDGFTVYARIRAERPTLPVILCSGHIPDDSKVVLDGKRVDFLAKPFSGAELLRAVRRLLDAASVG